MISTLHALKKSGYTLLEMTMVITLSGILAGIASPPLVEAIKSRNRLIIRNALLSEARFAVERILRDMREISAQDSDSSAADISTADDDRIDFENSSYRLLSNVVQRLSASDSSWYTIARNVSSFTLSYYDQDGNSLSSTPLSETNREKVRRVVVELEISKHGETLSVTSGAYLR